MKKIIALALLMCAFQLSYSQRATVKGTIVDTLNQTQLSNAVIMLLHSKDSTLYKFSRTNETGKFEFQNLKQGKYVLVVSYPTFADFVDTVTLEESTTKTFNKVGLTQLSRLLKEVVVQQTIAMRMKGDTTEYNAASFKTAENASIEDLLKILPGIEVNSKGEIKAQGESVQKVLVDGEEFFGDDPTLVTKNLRADMVDKVQVYDKTSDQAAFTGVDDGEKSKTINIQLKEDKKKGAFGKISLAGGTDGYHENQAMYNYFKGKKKVSVYGIISNTGKIGLNWQDKDKFGSGNGDFNINEDGDFDFTSRGDDLDSWDGRYNDDGHPLVQTGGLHYNDKWNGDKERVNANYKIMNLGVEGSTESKIQRLAKDTTFYDNSTGDFKNQIFRNRIDGDYELMFDTTSSLKVMVDGSLDHKSTLGHSISSTSRNEDLTNTSKRTAANIVDEGNLNSTVFWRKKLNKPRRTISFTFNEIYQKSNSDGNVDATTTFYRSGLEDSVQLLDQRKVNNSEKLNLTGNLVYTEPISKFTTLSVIYGFNWLNSSSNRLSYNQNPDGKYSSLDSLYSNDFSVNSFTNQAGLSYGITKNKLRVSFGGTAGITSFKQRDEFRDHDYNRQFVNWYPRALLRYNFTQFRRLSFTYNGRTNQPNINDLQPLIVNDNPLYVKIGNPDLKPSFNNSFNMNFSDYKVLTQRSIWASIGYNFTLNSFASRSDISSTGVTTAQTVNLNGAQNGWFNFNYYFRFDPLKVRFGPGIRMNYNKSANYTSGIIVNTESYNPGGSFSVSKYEDKKYEFGVDFRTSYHTSVSSIQRVQPNYWDYTINPNFGITLPAKFQLTGSMDYTIRQRTSIFTGNNNVAIVNASFNKKFGKKDDIILGVMVNDLLNQNIGINRNIYDNYISEDRRTTIQRYFMLTFVWNFSKLGGSIATTTAK